jgi:hypothetical protein
VAARYFGVADLVAVIEELPAAASGYEEEDIEMRLTRKYDEVL